MLRIILGFLALCSICNISKAQQSAVTLCGPSNYQFEVKGNYFDPGKKAYICPSDLPLVIRIMEIDPISGDHIPLQGTDFEWSKVDEIEGTYGEGHEAKLIEDHFKGDDKVEFKVEYIDVDENEQDLQFTIYKSLNKLRINDGKTHSKAVYAYDENTFHSAYPPNDDWTKPYKYIPSGLNDVIVFKEKDVLIQATEFSDNGPTVFSYASTLDKKLEISHLSSTTTTETDIIIQACDEDLIWTDVFPKHTLEINLYSLCESDDDKANYCHDFDKTNPPWHNDDDVRGDLQEDCETPINNADFVCIDPGDDGTLDQYSTRKYLEQNNDTNRKKDKYEKLENQKIYTYTVFPSYDSEFENRYFCNSRPHAYGDTPKVNDCSDLLSSSKLDKINQAFNKVYNQVGITVNINYHGRLNINYDHDKHEDGELSPIEQKELHLFRRNEHGTNVTAFESTEIWLTNFPDVEAGGSEGRATLVGSSFEYNSLAVDLDNIRGYIIFPHEMGHAKFGLYHPDGSGCRGGENGWFKEGLVDPVGNDSKNFMNSGCILDGMKDIEKFIFRNHQWNILLEKL